MLKTSVQICILRILMYSDPCSPNPCDNGGTCTVRGKSFYCLCPPGWAELDGGFCNYQKNSKTVSSYTKIIHLQ